MVEGILFTNLTFVTLWFLFFIFSSQGNKMCFALRHIFLHIYLYVNCCLLEMASGVTRQLNKNAIWF